jgi:hypothetical protein
LQVHPGLAKILQHFGCDRSGADSVLLARAHIERVAQVAFETWVSPRKQPPLVAGEKPVVQNFLR